MFFWLSRCGNLIFFWLVIKGKTKNNDHWRFTLGYMPCRTGTNRTVTCWWRMRTRNLSGSRAHMQRYVDRSKTWCVVDSRAGRTEIRASGAETIFGVVLFWVHFISRRGSKIFRNVRNNADENSHNFPKYCIIIFCKSNLFYIDSSRQSWLMITFNKDLILSVGHAELLLREPKHYTGEKLTIYHDVVLR